MTFDEVLDHVLEMLQRRGRVSYRALKRQFDLDDAYLEDLKAEIIDVHQMAVDQDGRMLVWTSPEHLPLSLGCFVCVHNGRRRGKALLAALLALLLT
jgi:hypothetical protein